MNNLILAYDLGTTSCKASIFTPEGDVLASAFCSYDTFHLKPTWAEQNPCHWWEAVKKSTREIISKNPQAQKGIKVIGVSGHMLGCLPVDKEGNPLRRHMLHSDTRAIKEWEKLEKNLGKEEIYKITGNRIDPRSTISKIMWIKQNEPDIYKKTFKFLQSKDYLTYRLTGCLGVTDYSDASHGVLFDINKKVWSETLVKAGGIDKDRLPEVHSSVEITGHLGRNQAQELSLISGIPVVVGGGDGACATAGAGAVRNGQTYNYLGGTAWIATTLNKPFIEPKMRVFNILALDSQKCGVYGTIQSGGSSYQWVSELFGETDYEKLNKLAESAEPGSQGLFFLPYLMGERSPIWDPYARGVYFGLTLSHRREELVRATIEGVAYALKSILEIMEEAIKIKELRLIGGGGRGEIWREILTNVYGKKVLVLKKVAEATSYGAAIAAGTGVGIFKDFEAAVKMIKIDKEYFPDKVVQKRYRKNFCFYKSLYPHLKNSFYSLQEL